MSLPHHLILRPEFRTAQQGQAGEGEGTAVSREQARGGSAPEGQPGAPVPQPAQRSPLDQEACLSNLPWILGMVAIFYFLLIRPQQKQEKQRRQMLGALSKGDKVVTSGGLHGTIASIDDDTVVLKVDANLKLTFDRAHIGRVAGGEQKAGDKK